MPQTVAINKRPYARVINGKTEGVNTNERKGRNEQNNAYYLGTLAPQTPSGDIQLAGVVTSHDDGQPLPDVSVNVVGKPVGAVTDANGKFILPGVKKDETLLVGSVGYNSQKVNVGSTDTVKVELDASQSALSEVVVVNGTVKAHPRKGWDYFKAYLKKNALLPAGAKKGRVQLQFKVNSKGNVSDITVIKSLSAYADKKAVALIKNGPAWIANSKGITETVSLKINFE
nr:TonB family protein [Mucilaginibacter segetis]